MLSRLTYLAKQASFGSKRAFSSKIKVWYPHDQPTENDFDLKAFVSTAQVVWGNYFHEHKLKGLYAQTEANQNHAIVDILFPPQRIFAGVNPIINYGITTPKIVVPFVTPLYAPNFVNWLDISRFANSDDFALNVMNTEAGLEKLNSLMLFESQHMKYSGAKAISEVLDKIEEIYVVYNPNIMNLNGKFDRKSQAQEDARLYSKIMAAYGTNLKIVCLPPYTDQGKSNFQKHFLGDSKEELNKIFAGKVQKFITVKMPSTFVGADWQSAIDLKHMQWVSDVLEHSPDLGVCVSMNLR